MRLDEITAASRTSSNTPRAQSASSRARSKFGASGRRDAARACCSSGDGARARCSWRGPSRPKLGPLIYVDAAPSAACSRRGPADGHEALRRPRPRPKVRAEGAIGAPASVHGRDRLIGLSRSGRAAPAWAGMGWACSAAAAWASTAAQRDGLARRARRGPVSAASSCAGSGSSAAPRQQAGRLRDRRHEPARGA